MLEPDTASFFRRVALILAALGLGTALMDLSCLRHWPQADMGSVTARWLIAASMALQVIPMLGFLIAFRLRRRLDGSLPKAGGLIAWLMVSLVALAMGVSWVRFGRTGSVDG